ncbi:Lrp/AsnC family transcriptional regulator [Zhihengliuella sp.]|uniref:Lrp/AsnC family transcriptional regulator n=1 Tax=Zhihengliuella sp. TaxID=1954483 RepID=UPI0028115219|nr:Lrp/AsnC family transcriptional regulator [Zhihengliuella sp.]
MPRTAPRLDSTDLELLLRLVNDPRAQISELADSLGLARNTVHTRFRRLVRAGILRDGGRDIDLAALGYDVLAFITIEVDHRELDSVVAALGRREHVLEVFETSGRGDVWCRVAARDTHNLQQVLRHILKLPGVIRTETSLALSEHIPFRAGPLVRHSLADA